MTISVAPNAVLRSTATARTVVCLLVLATVAGCAPTVDILGVYFPPWLVCGSTGIALAYGFVWLLGRNAITCELAQSGLLFCGLTVGVGLTLWWTLFSEF